MCPTLCLRCSDLVNGKPYFKAKTSPADINCIRSICPGRHIAVRTLWGTIAAVLSLFDIGPALNEDGTPNIPSGEFTSNLLRQVFTLSYFLFQPSFICTSSIEIQLPYLPGCVTVYFEFGSDFAPREPKPFKCTIKPRSLEAEKLVKALGETVTFELDG
jgi:hypothetical protein